MKAITTRSGVAYKGPLIPTNHSPKKVVERETKETTDKKQSNFQGSTAHIPPPVNPIQIPKPDVPNTLPKPNISYPSRRNDQKSRDKALNQMEKIFQIFQDLRFDISFADALLLMPRFAPTIRICLPPPEDDDDKKEKQEVKNIAEPTVKRQTRIISCLKNFKVIQKESIFHSNKTPQNSSVFAITSALPKDFLIMRDEHFNTFRVEEIVPIPRESEDTFDNNKGCDLTFCDNDMIFSNPLFGSKDNLSSRDDESILKEGVQEENFQVYSNPLFEFDDNHNSSNINLLFKEMVEDVESENSNVSNFDEPVLLKTLFLDKAECFDPGGDNDKIHAFLAIEFSTNIEEGYYDSEGDVFYLESFLSNDTTHNLSSEVFFDHEPQHFKNESDHDTSITFSPKNDPLHHEFAGEIITNPSRIDREHEEYIKSLPTFPISVQDSDSHREEIDIFLGPDDSIPPGVKTPFLTPVSPFRAGDISLGWNFHECWTGLHEMAMAAFESQYIDKDTYLTSAEDIEVQSYFLDDQLTNLSPPRNFMKRVGSIEPFENPLDIRKLESSSYHALGACLRPYNAFLRRSSCIDSIHAESAMASLMFFGLVRLTRDGVDRKTSDIKQSVHLTLLLSQQLEEHFLDFVDRDLNCLVQVP
ncbi:hypothetical protein Tco_0389263 [Tanacetum coccineum]